MKNINNYSFRHIFSDRNKLFATYGITYYLFFLFLYASLIKLFNYDAYSAYINGLPVLQGAVKTFVLIVPMLELMVATLVFIKFTSRIGLYIAFIHFLIMSLFWHYIATDPFSVELSITWSGMMGDITDQHRIYFNLILAMATILGIALKTTKHLNKVKTS